MKRLIAFTNLFFVCLLCSCGTTNLYAKNPTVDAPVLFPGGRVYVENPELMEELAVLKASGIYEISDDPILLLHLTLEPRQLAYGCGTPYMLTFITFGLFPATMPADSIFTYSLSDRGETKKFAYKLDAVEKVSPLQYLFKPFMNEERTLGAILRTEYLKQTDGGG